MRLIRRLSIETRRDLSSMLDFVVDDSGRLRKRAVAQEQIPGPLTPARSSALSMAGRDLRIVADSDGRSLIIVPVEFSHCLELNETHPGTGSGPTVLRIDGLLTGSLSSTSRCHAVFPHRPFTQSGLPLGRLSGYESRCSGPSVAR